MKDIVWVARPSLKHQGPLRDRGEGTVICYQNCSCTQRRPLWSKHCTIAIYCSTWNVHQHYWQIIKDETQWHHSVKMAKWGILHICGCICTWPSLVLSAFFTLSILQFSDKCDLIAMYAWLSIFFPLPTYVWNGLASQTTKYDIVTCIASMLWHKECHLIHT